MMYFIIVYSVLFVILSWSRPKYALFLLLALLPTYTIRFQFFSIPLTLLEAMILILFIVSLYKRQIHIYDVSKDWRYLILAWLVAASIAVFLAPDLRGALGIWKAYFIEPILLLGVFLSFVKTKKDVQFALGALGLSVLYISVWAILQKFIGGGVLSTEVWKGEQIWRATGPFPHPNFLGLYIGPILILAIGQAVFYFKKNIRIAGYIFLVCVLAVLSLIYARSEGALLGAFVGLVFLGLIYKLARKWTIIGLVILIIVISIIPGASAYVLEKATLSDLSGRLRINIWQGASEMIQDNSLTGVGLNGYQRLAPAYQNRYYDEKTGELISVETHPYPHNIFLAVWLELGLIGLVVFLFIIVQFFSHSIGNFKNSLTPKFKFFTISVIGSMIVILIHGLVDTPYFKNDLSVLFWLIIGMGTAFRRGAEENQ